jgi:catechol 2,3-dioxygenase-like lactoylglutathione lyase family enzyme
MTKTSLTAGVHHVGFTVPDIQATARFFIDRLGYSVVGEKPEYPAIFVSDGATMLTLWQAETSAVPFDRKTNIGLHHIALNVVDQSKLDGLHNDLLADPDVGVEFCPEALGASGWRHMMCSIPGGLRVEFICTGS